MRKIIALIIITTVALLSAYGQKCSKHEENAIKASKSGKYDEAIRHAFSFLQEMEKTKTKTDPCQLKSLILVAGLLDNMNNHDSSVIFWHEAAKVVMMQKAEVAPALVSALENTISMLQTLPNAKQAAEIYQQALPILQSIDTVDYSIIIKITTLYSESFQKLYNTGADTVSQYMQKLKKEHGENSLRYIDELSTVALKHKELFKQREARNLYAELLSLREKNKQTQTLSYAKESSNLGYLYYLQLMYDSSSYHYQKSIDVFEQISQTDFPEYAWALFYRAILHQFKQNWAEAILLYKKGIPYFRTHFGEDSPFFPTILVGLGNLLLIDKNFEDAEQYFLEDLRLREKDTVESSRFASYIGMGRVELLKKNYAAAEEYFVKANNITIKQIHDIQDILGISTEKKAAQYFNSFRYSLDSYYSLFSTRVPENPRLAGNMLDNELLSKGLILRSIKQKLDIINNSNDTELVASFNNWVQIRQQLSKLNMLPVSERKSSVPALESAAKKIENDVYIKVFTYSKDKKQEPLNWKRVQQQLMPGEAVIEFINFNYYMYGEQWRNDSAIYGAIVLTHNAEHPVYTQLFTQKEMAAFLDKFEHYNSYDLVRMLYEENGNSLYNFVWRPFASQLENIKKLYISPSGLLHKIAFHAIPQAENVLLSDIYDIHILSTSAMLTNNSQPLHLTKEDDVLLYGGIFYDLDTNSIDYYSRKFRGMHDDFFIHDRSMAWSDSLRGGSYWPYLEGTLEEVDYIKNILEENEIGISRLSGKEAVEESFKYSETHQPKVIHIATHGFFFPDLHSPPPKDEIVQYTDIVESSEMSRNPMLRSGLIFAGANRVWQGDTPVPGAEDGILTAYEVSHLNLSKTGLVVLSACETGLGDIKGSEGVYGLQRAFMMAGVEYIIMSLWQVPDEQTVELMTLFYKKWLGGSEIREAFIYAQRELRKKYPPFYWAAFVLVQ